METNEGGRKGEKDATWVAIHFCKGDDNLLPAP